jgi:hypothetical protein
MYSTFLEINHTLHPVCRSVYTTDEFITYLSSSNPLLDTQEEFQLNGASLFQALTSLCRLAEDWISINLAQFYLSNHIETFVVPVELFRYQSAALVRQFISSTTKSFFASLQIVRNTTQANALLSALLNNYDLTTAMLYTEVTVNARVYDDNCRCDSSNTCVTKAVVYSNSSFTSAWTLPGLYTGCYVLEALLQSHLGCFFDEVCLETFHVRLESTLAMNTTVLDRAAIGNFSTETTIGAILNELMVAAWSWSAEHANYFAECQPKECTYTVTGRNDAIYIVTTVIGLIDGLVTALKLMIPRFVSLIIHIVQRRRRNAVIEIATRGRNGVQNRDQVHVFRA